MRRVFLGIGVALAVVLGLAGAQQYGVPKLIDLTRRGRRLQVTTLDASGSVVETPLMLALNAGVVMGRSVEVGANALARMVRSEEGSASLEVKKLLCHVAFNVADQRGVGVDRLLTTSTVADRNGKFGKQITRWASTARDSYEQDLLAAEEAIAERKAGLDPTGGARKFVDRLAFGVQPGTGSYTALVEKWAAEGLYPVRLPGVPLRIIFFRRGNPAADSQAVA